VPSPAATHDAYWGFERGTADALAVNYNGASHDVTTSSNGAAIDVNDFTFL
jgi:hypothetical protein